MPRSQARHRDLERGDRSVRIAIHGPVEEVAFRRPRQRNLVTLRIQHGGRIRRGLGVRLVQAELVCVGNQRVLSALGARNQLFLTGLYNLAEVDDACVSQAGPGLLQCGLALQTL